MKRLAVLVLALLLIVSFCSCKPQGNIPVISPSDQSNSSDITESENANSNETHSNPSSSPSTSNNENGDTSSDQKDSQSNSSVVSGTTTDNPNNPQEETNFKICYSQLNEKQKSIYNTLEKAVQNMETGWISLGAEAFPNYRRDVNVVVTALQNDMPQYFWIPPAYYTGNSQDGETIRILFEGQDDLTYLIDKSERRQMEDALADSIDEIMAQITATTPFEIELQLHDILCSRVTYATSTENPLVYTAYGALVDGIAVCEGYSRAMQLLLAQYNIKSTLITGEADSVGHMWNLVNIENEWYHLDTTWDDSMGTYAYFNITDYDIAKDHGRYKVHTELSYDEIVCETPEPYNFELPLCTKMDNNYFVKKDYIYSPNGEEKIAKILMQPFERVEFRFSSDDFKAQFDENKNLYLIRINEILRRENSDFKISQYLVTETTLIIYKN